MKVQSGSYIVWFIYNTDNLCPGSPQDGEPLIEKKMKSLKQKVKYCVMLLFATIVCKKNNCNQSKKFINKNQLILF